MVVSIASVAIHGRTRVRRHALVHKPLGARVRPAGSLTCILHGHRRRQEGVLVATRFVATVPDCSRSIESSSRQSVTNIRTAVIRDGSLPVVVSWRRRLWEALNRRVSHGFGTERLNKGSTASDVRVRREYGGHTTTVVLSTGLGKLLLDARDVTLCLGELQFQPKELLSSNTIVWSRTGRSSSGGSAIECVSSRGDGQGAAGGGVGRDSVF